jgi:hypothetical protein
MRANELKRELVVTFRENSVHQDFRGYVGMSGIGGCLRDLYWRAVKEIPGEDRLAWYGWTGYLHEAAVKRLMGAHREAMLTFLGGSVPVGRELVAAFDERYRGHTDHELEDGTLIEIKSVNWRRFQQVRERGAFERHVAQVQAYMRHGKYEHAIIVYVARDADHREWVFPFWCVDVASDMLAMDRLDGRAMTVLAAIDAEMPPECTCGYCRRFGYDDE